MPVLMKLLRQSYGRIYHEIFPSGQKSSVELKRFLKLQLLITGRMEPMAQKSWHDIDLGGLTMENSDEDKLASGGHQDRQERIDIEKLKKLSIGLEDVIPVEIDNPSANSLLKGMVQDVSPLGIKIALSGKITENDIVRLVFSIGKRRMAMKAEVRWTKEEGVENIVGLRFINPDEKDVEFINSIFTAIYLQ